MRKFYFAFVIAAFFACEPEKVTDLKQDEEQNNTTDTTKTVDCASVNLVLNASSTDANCDHSDGAVTLEVSGGATPYTYSLSSDLSNTTGVFEGLSSGAYIATVSDSNGCSNTLEVSIKNADGVSIDELAIEQAGCGTSEGIITISASGGSEPYAYSATGQTPNTDGVFTGLSKGTYKISVTDYAGCVSEGSATITSGATLTGDVMPIIQANCITQDCHGGGEKPLLTSGANVISNASKIQKEISQGKMPPNNKLPSSQSELILCWINEGSQNN